ncbi:MAG: protein kinase [Gammaproteobacteria bacterium]
MSEKLPDKIGKYEIVGVAGKGAMGVVYIGHDPFVDRKVAIKVSLSATAGEFSLDETMAADNHRQFFNEAKAAGTLDHPNIIKVYEAGDANGQDYIAIEFVEDADTLRSFRKPKDLLPINQVLNYIRQCAEGLNYAHERGITHRDIKPANLLLTKDGEVKVADFGIAVRTAHDKTSVSKGFGSPLYMSPEQASGAPLTHQTDIFSLGVVLYELLAGVHPFQASTMPALFKNIISVEPKPVQEYRSEVPPSLAKIIDKVLQKDPKDRYANCAELADSLRKVELEIETSEEQLTNDQKLELLSKLKFFDGFSEHDIEEILEEGEWEIYLAGTHIMKEGEQEKSFYVITSGNAAVTKMDKEIATLTDGDCFGEMAWIHGGKRSATITAISKTVVLKLEESLPDWASLSCQMRINKTIQKILIERLDETSQRYARVL